MDGDFEGKRKGRHVSQADDFLYFFYFYVTLYLSAYLEQITYVKWIWRKEARRLPKLSAWEI